MHPSRRQDITSINIEGLFKTSGFQDTVARRLADSVKIPTISYDGMEHVGVDPRWDVFYRFSEFLQGTFPRVHRELNFETVNEHGLLYTWQGTNKDKRPLLLMAHSDVVPAGESTTDEWTHPPFSGHYDGEYIWGRGSEDDKSNLIAMLTAVDCLLEQKFSLERTLVISVGFDEEGGAEQSYGARCLADKLLHRYGRDGIEIIFDEGVPGIEKRFGTDFALPATGEKGYMDVTVTVTGPGGHSSTPPDHTLIGSLCQIVCLIEAHPFRSQLVRNNPTLTYLRQAALYSKSMPQELRDAVLGTRKANKLLTYMDEDRERRAMIRTSTAVDIMNGGDKVNSLPESATATINHRIAIQDSIQAVKDRYIELLKPWSKDNGFVLNAFADVSRNEMNGAASVNTVTVTTQYELEPSPVSSAEDPRFGLLAGTIKGVFGDDVVVAPEMLTGNTDTRYYWELCSQIYRWSPWRASHDPRGTRMHTVDERMPMKGLMEMVKFYHEFIRIVDEMQIDDARSFLELERRGSSASLPSQHGCIR